MDSRLRTLAPAVLLLLSCAASFGQRLDPFFSELPFAQWAAEAARPSEIPWKVRVASGGLTVHQRMFAFIHIDLDSRYIAQRGNEGNLFALVQISDADGRLYQDHSEAPELNQTRSAARKKGAFYFFDWRMFILPGHYSVVVALFDKSTGKHSFTRIPLTVEPLSKDPLPDAWRNTPTIEFLKHSEPPDSFFHPESTTRLAMPVQSRRPVRIELLANLTGSGRATVSHAAYNFNLNMLLPIVKAFSHMDVEHGSLNVTALDLVRRRIAFDQTDVHTLDWPALKAAVTAADPAKVDVKALEDVRHTALFLRGEVAQRLQPRSDSGDALPVLIFISSSDFFDSLDDLSGVTLPAECDCRVFYIRYNPVALRYHYVDVDFDNVQRVLKPLKVRLHVAETPAGLRKIMAAIFDEVSKM